MASIALVSNKTSLGWTICVPPSKCVRYLTCISNVQFLGGLILEELHRSLVMVYQGRWESS